MSKIGVIGMLEPSLSNKFTLDTVDADRELDDDKFEHKFGKTLAEKGFSLEFNRRHRVLDIVKRRWWFIFYDNERFIRIDIHHNKVEVTGPIKEAIPIIEEFIRQYQPSGTFTIYHASHRYRAIGGY